MNWDAISAVSETVSSIAVIISLIYLAQQIRHSNKLSQSQTRTDLRQQACAEVESLIQHPDIWLMFWKEELTDLERSRLHSFMLRALRFREYIWRQHKLGLLDKDTFETYILVVTQQLSSKRTRDWWNSYKLSGTFDPEFIKLVDRLVEETPPFDLRQHIEKF